MATVDSPSAFIRSPKVGALVAQLDIAIAEVAKSKKIIFSLMNSSHVVKLNGRQVVVRKIVSKK